MTSPTTLTDAQRDEVLTAAAGRGVPVTITRAGDDTWTQLRSRFLPGDTEAAVTARNDLNGLQIEGPTDERGRPASPPIQRGELLDVTFRHSHYKFMFRTPVRTIDTAIGAATTGVTLERPPSVRRVQRRAFQRLTVPRHCHVNAELTTTSGDGSASINGQVADLSAGGMCLRLTQKPTLSPTIGQPFRITIRPPSSRPLNLNGLYRHCNIDANGQVQWGLQIVGLDDSPRGRDALNGLTQLTRALSGRTPSTASR